MAQEHRSRRGVPAWGCKGFRIAREPLFSLDKPRIVRYTPLVNRLPLKRLGLAPLFDPTQGVTVIEPPGSGPGWWSGAPGALYDDETRLSVVEV